MGDAQPRVGVNGSCWQVVVSVLQGWQDGRGCTGGCQDSERRTARTARIEESRIENLGGSAAEPEATAHGQRRVIVSLAIDGP